MDRPDRQSIAAPTSAASADAVESAVDAELEDSAEPETIHARSLMLSAPAEGLLAKLDLLEIDGLTATPVDYKRGQAPKIPEGAWEPERVQLCAQGLILRENGFTCTHGVLYYIGSKKRVTIEFTSELIARTRQLRDEFRAAAAAGVIPPPLEDSPKGCNPKLRKDCDRSEKGGTAKLDLILSAFSGDSWLQGIRREAVECGGARWKVQMESSFNRRPRCSVVLLQS